MCLCVLLTSVSVFADGVNNESGKHVTKKSLNPPAVGSKQGSTAVFGNPDVNKAGRHKGDFYKTRNQSVSQKNKPTVGGSRAVGSEQTFGSPKVTGTKGTAYYTEDQKAKGPNKSIQGSKMGSNQVFDYPGTIKKPDGSKDE